jgi:tetratricopeptide (TPR) repeat protein
MENTDEELIRFVARRTSTKDPVLGLPDATALLLAFSGRTSVLLEGGYRADFSAREVAMTRLLYGDEAPLYLRCRDDGIRYLLYSIDYLLDTTRYSPLYLAGLALAPQRCVATSMQFAPEELTHFNLVYENDRYRLFRVTDGPEPVFLTDHPPVYQRDILRRHGDDYRSFRERIGRLMVVYSEAREMANLRRFDAAIGRLNWCLEQAPGFTRARVALGAALLENGQAERASEVLMSVIQYAPDNTDALYLAADALSTMGQNEKALSLLEILYGATRDSDVIERAKLLEALIRRDSQAPDSTGAASGP